MQAMEKMDQERDRGLKETVRRARLVASGWRPRQEDGAAMRSQVHEKMDTTLQASQERRNPQKVQQQKTAEVLLVQVKASVETSNGCGEGKTQPLSKNAKNTMKNTAVSFINVII